MSTLEISAPLSANTQAILLRLVPVYTLPGTDAALETLGKKGALTWPNPTTPEEFREA